MCPGIFLCVKELKSKIIGDAGSREGSEKLPPPRDCNRDESRDKATVRKDGKARRVG